MGIFELISVIQVNNLSQPFHSLREAFGDNFLQVPQKYLENIRWNILRRSAKILPIYKKYFKTISWNFPIYITFKSILIPIPEVSGCLCVQWGWDPGGPGHYWHSWNLGRRWYVRKTLISTLNSSQKLQNRFTEDLWNKHQGPEPTITQKQWLGLQGWSSPFSQILLQFLANVGQWTLKTMSDNALHKKPTQARCSHHHLLWRQQDGRRGWNAEGELVKIRIVL